MERKVDRWLPSPPVQSQPNSKPPWQPNPDRNGIPNPQRLALESEADILGYGGAAGGGKTDLLLGLACTQHTHSVIFRQTNPLLRGIIERSKELYNPEGEDHSKDSYNESLHRWVLDNGKRLIEFEHCQLEKDKERQRGRPRDFYGFDEATELSRTRFEFIIGWLRSTKPGQRCRVIMTFNPPSDESGNWVIDYFLPWIAYLFPAEYQHPNPAAPGELRWYTTIDGKETEVESGEPFELDGEWIKPMSRTFIPARLSDNPHLNDTNYSAVLRSLPEPLRSQVLYGDFAAHKIADPWQVIPTAWVKLAQKRWLEMEKPETYLNGVGVDVARGGRDNLVICKRYENWFAEPVVIPGVQVEDGPAAAGYIHQALAGDRILGYINIDVIGVGTSAYDSAKVMYPQIVNPVNASEASSFIVTAEKGQTVIRMRNVRAEYYWRFRMALDPEHGDNLALPPGNEIVSDLCAAKYKWVAGGIIQIESKDEIKKRISRSPDIGESFLLAYLPGDMASPYPLSVDEDTPSRWTKSTQEQVPVDASRWTMDLAGGNGSRWKR